MDNGLFNTAGIYIKNCVIQPKENIKIASFDLDYTLNKTKSGSIFPVSFNDWKPLYNNISQILHQYIENGCIIVNMIFFKYL